MLTVSPINFNQNYKTNQKQRYSQTAFGVNAKLGEEFEQTLIKNDKLRWFKNYMAETWGRFTDTISFNIQKALSSNEADKLVLTNETKGVMLKDMEWPAESEWYEGAVDRGLHGIRTPFLNDTIKKWNEDLIRHKARGFINKATTCLDNDNFHKFISDITQFKNNLIQTRNILPSTEIKLNNFYTEAGEKVGIYANDDLLYTLNKDENLDVNVEYLWSKLKNNPRYELGSNKNGKIIRFKPNFKPKTEENKPITEALAVAGKDGRYMLQTVENGLPVKRIIKGENNRPIETEKLKDGKTAEKLFHREDGSVSIDAKYDKDGEYVKEAIKRNENGKIENKYENLGKSEKMTMYSDNKPIFSQEIDRETGIIEDVDYNDKGMRQKAVKYEQSTVQDVELVDEETVNTNQTGIAVYNPETNSSSTFENIVKRKIEEIDFENNNPIFKRFFGENGNNVATVDFKKRSIKIFNDQNELVEKIKFGFGKCIKEIFAEIKAAAKPIDSLSKRLSPNYKSTINSLSDNNKMIEINKVKIYDKGKLVETYQIEDSSIFELFKNNTNGEEISRIRLDGDEVWGASLDKFDINNNLTEKLSYKIPKYGDIGNPELTIKNIISGEKIVIEGEYRAMENPDIAALVDEAKAKFKLYNGTRIV